MFVRDPLAIWGHFGQHASPNPVSNRLFKPEPSPNRVLFVVGDFGVVQLRLHELGFKLGKCENVAVCIECVILAHFKQKLESFKVQVNVRFFWEF